MTIIDDHWMSGRPVGRRAPAPDRAYLPQRRRPVTRPHPARPPALMCHRGTGVAMSTAAHRPRRPADTVGLPVTVALAALAGLITVWLGLLAQHAAVGRSAVAPQSPERLAVVQVQAGETLQQLAGRMAPDSPADAVAERIRDLNGLGSSAVEAGQTLLSPVS